MVTLSSPVKREVMLAVSVATVISSATAVLRECAMGGKDDLGVGGWSVGVSRGVVTGGRGLGGRGVTGPRREGGRWVRGVRG